MDRGRLSANADDTTSRSDREIGKLPVLGTDTEAALCLRWRDHHDIDAAHRLAAGHRHLVVLIARGYRGYGLPLEDVMGEGHLGLMRAVCRFDPDRGVPFATYAAWRIRAAIQEYVLNSRSLARQDKTASRKQLLSGLRRMRNHLRDVEEGAPMPPRAAASRGAVPAEPRPRLF